MKSDRSKDYLVIGTVDDQPAISRLNSSLPVGVDGSGLHIQDTQGFFAQLQHAWWKVRSSDHVQSGQLETAGGLPDALIEGIEWPSGSNRSVVVIALRDKDVVPNFLSVFLKTSQSSDISQSVSVLHGSRFVSYRIGNDVYRVGSLSLWNIKLNMLFATLPVVDGPLHSSLLLPHGNRGSLLLAKKSPLPAPGKRLTCGILPAGRKRSNASQI